MKTYVAVINGESLLVFRAEDDTDARKTVDDPDGGVRGALLEVLREDGAALWNGTDAIELRPATGPEDARWLEEARSESGEDRDDVEVYLVPVYEPEADEPEAA